MFFDDGLSFTDEGGEKVKYLYLELADLEAASRRAGRGRGELKVEVTELYGVVKEIVRDGGGKRDPELDQLRIWNPGRRDKFKDVKFGERMVVL